MAKTIHICKKIIGSRDYAKITQEELAFKSGLTLVHIRKLEKGAVNNPSCHTIQKIARATKVKHEWFVRGVDFSPENTPD